MIWMIVIAVDVTLAVCIGRRLRRQQGGEHA